MPRKTIVDFVEMKKRGEKITWLTCYDYPMATIMDKAGLDMILVGDSMGNVVYGYSGTLPVTMAQCIFHTEAVRRGAPNVFVIGDMPFMSYHKSVEDAIANAGRFYKECGVDAIKLEGGVRVVPQIKGIVSAGMVVIGHVGLTPQSTAALGGFKAQGNTAETAMIVLEDALAVQEAGAAMLLVEAVPPETCKVIWETLKIPVLGIGAGPHCDGQVLIVHDMLGIFEVFTPKFVKKYDNLADSMLKAFQAYIKDVHEVKFPAPEHFYKMKPGEAEKLEQMVKARKKAM
jgi:3-methyl-2-oxobutanoate hydroxymethyltransferase